MKIYIIIAILFLITIIASQKPHPGAVPTQPPIYNVNLDLPPKDRWKEIIPKFADNLEKFQVYFDKELTKNLQYKDQFFSLLEFYAKNLYQYVDIFIYRYFTYQEIVEELTSIAEITNWPLGKLFYLNFFYEFSTIKACTSILIRNDQGNILHGRNLDFIAQQFFSKLTATVNFQKNGNTIFVGDVIFPSVFVTTGFKNQTFSITEDTRTNDQSYISTTLVNIVFKNYISPQWLIRKVLEEEISWENAVERLKSTKITSPIYFIVGGVNRNEGVVIERKSEGIHGYYQLSDDLWFLVQTNYDRDQPDPTDDYRRIPAENKLKSIGQSINSQLLFDHVLSQFPSLNSHSILTLNAIVGANYMESYVWFGSNQE